MTFATRSDLLARSSARRLMQLAVPTDHVVPPGDALRLAINGGALDQFTADEITAIMLALAAIDQALADAYELMQSYGIPVTATSTLLARIESTIALYYLQGAERMTSDIKDAYEAAIATLKDHGKGNLNLLQLPVTVPPLPEDQILMGSATRRYGAPIPDGGW